LPNQFPNSYEMLLPPSYVINCQAFYIQTSHIRTTQIIFTGSSQVEPCSLVIACRGVRPSTVLYSVELVYSMDTLLQYLDPDSHHYSISY